MAYCLLEKVSSPMLLNKLCFGIKQTYLLYVAGWYSMLQYGLGNS